MRISKASIPALLVLGAGAACTAAQPTGPDHPQTQQSISSTTDDVIKRMLMEGARGSLAITVVQGTRNGPPVGEIDVRIDLYHQNNPIYEMHAGTDASGVAMIGDLPVAVEVRPVVRVEYGGVSYLEVGPRMDSTAPDAVVKLTVYETTGDAPAWRVSMRHVLASRVPGGMFVEEMLVVENPSDSTWLGGEPDEEERRTAVRVGLPEGARDVDLVAGFHGWCCTTYEGRELAVQMPLMPGQTTYRFTYVVPELSSGVDLRVASPVATDSMVVFVPDDGAEASPEALNAAGTEAMGQAMVRIYEGRGIGEGREAGVRLASLRRAAPATTGAGGSGVRTLAIAGGALAVVVGIGAVIVRSRRQRRETAGVA